MSVKIACPKCDAATFLEEEHLGKSLRCRKCKNVFKTKARAKADPDEVEEVAPRKSPSKDRQEVQTRPTSRRPRDDDDEEPRKQRGSKTERRERDDDDDEPRKERNRKNERRDRDDDDLRPRKKSLVKEPSKGSALPWILGGGAAALVLLVVCVVGGLWWLRGRAVAGVQAAAQQAMDNPLPAAGDNKPNPNPNPNPNLNPNPDPNPNPGPPILVNGQLPPEVLSKVKRGTGFIRVTMADGSRASGSGFVANVGDTQGIVLTNAHVVGMLEAESRPPKSVEVTFNSGEADERKFPATIICVDGLSDLAVLRVTGANLPKPLDVQSAANLVETQKVFVFGFPLGERLGKEITIRESSVSSLRKENGVLNRVQVNGGMDPGNSGGPVVDSRGDVVGVAVSGITATQINFAIPGDHVRTILGGRISLLGNDGDAYVLPNGSNGLQVRVTLLDPLSRARSVSVDIWTGDPAEKRGPSREKAPVLPGDSDHVTAQLTLEEVGGFATHPGERLAHGDVPLAALPQGKVYWIQASFVNGANEVKWVSPSVRRLDLNANPPLERKPATLFVKYQNIRRVMELTCTTTLKRSFDGDAAHSSSISVIGNLVEDVVGPDPQGNARITLQYARFRMSLSKDGVPLEKNDRLDALMKSVPSVVGVLQVDAQGNITKNITDLSRVPAKPPIARELASDMHEQIQHSLEAVAVPLPNRSVQPGDTWKAFRTLPIDDVDGAGKFESGAMDMTYEYRGKRVRQGREEAIINIKGVLKGPPGQETNMGGWAIGSASVDIATGQVISATTKVTLDMTSKTRLGTFKQTGTFNMKLDRPVPK
jgi:S1-C subfamily serine protease